MIGYSADRLRKNAITGVEMKSLILQEYYSSLHIGQSDFHIKDKICDGAFLPY